tara:strand:+ start:1186 stop:1662 length:477 start_codon:yes stop_codon:yes gene_type:complete
MPEIQLTLYPGPLNNSLQAGDTIYYIAANNQVDEFYTNDPNDQITEIGTLKTITFNDINGQQINVGEFDEDFSFNAGAGPFNNAPNLYQASNETITLTCEIGANTNPPAIDDFLFFSKDRNVNEASIIGYYGDFKFENNSRKPAELFAATCDISESSK